MPAEVIPLQFRDVAPVIELCGRALHADAISPAKFARYVLLDPSFDAAGALVAKIDGEVAGFVYAAARQPPVDATDATRGYVTILAVDEQFRRRGIARALVLAAEQSLRDRGRSVAMVSTYGPSYITPGIDLVAYPAAVALSEKLGYEEVYRPISMRTDLTALPPENEFVQSKRRALAEDGAVIESFRVEHARPILDFAFREFGIDWYSAYRDAMTQIVRDTPAHGTSPPSAQRISLVHKHGEVLGVSHFDGERFGPIGVAAAARSRGIGQILMFETLYRQRDAGHKSAWFLWSDDKTARRLYDYAGFKEVRRFVVVSKALT